MATSNSFIGFHAAYNPSDLRESGAANALVGSYLEKLGFGWGTIVYLTSAAPKEMEWLDGAKAEKYGIRFYEYPSNDVAQDLSSVQRYI